MRSFDPFNRVIEALTQTGPISGVRVSGARVSAEHRAVAGMRVAALCATCEEILNREDPAHRPLLRLAHPKLTGDSNLESRSGV
jgi:hypothetical protein